jgi:hypothetical protein
MALFHARRTRAAAIVVLATLALTAWAHTTAKTDSPSSLNLENLSLADLDAQLQVRPPP